MKWWARYAATYASIVHLFVNGDGRDERSGVQGCCRLVIKETLHCCGSTVLGFQVGKKIADTELNGSFVSTGMG